MEILVKAVVVGALTAITALLIKRASPEISLALALAGTALVVALALRLMSEFKEIVTMASDLSGLSPAVISPVMKCVGLGIVTRIGSDVCKDAEQTALASSVELAGAAAAMFVALPLFKTLVTMVGEMI